MDNPSPIIFPKELPPELKRNWKRLFALGFLFVIFGSIGLWMLVALTLASVFFLGILLLIAGGSQLVDVFRSKHWKAAVWHGLVGLLYLVASGLIMYDPIFVSTIITAFLAWSLIVMGIVRFIMAIVLRHSSGWGWPLLAGITSLVLGVCILIQWPYSGLWVIGLFIAIEMIINGWSYIFLSLTLRES